jgi:hypothetical protein
MRVARRLTAFALVAVLLGEDRFHGRAFWLNVALYLLVTVGAWRAVRRDSSLDRRPWRPPA